MTLQWFSCLLKQTTDIFQQTNTQRLKWHKWVFHYWMSIKRYQYCIFFIRHTLNLRSTFSPVYGSTPVIGGSANGIPLNAWYFCPNELINSTPSTGPFHVSLIVVSVAQHPYCTKNTINIADANVFATFFVRFGKVISKTRREVITVVGRLTSCFRMKFCSFIQKN